MNKIAYGGKIIKGLPGLLLGAAKAVPGSLENTWRSGALGKAKILGGAGALTLGGGKLFNTYDWGKNIRGRQQLAEDSATQMGSLSNAARIALGVGAGSALLTGLSHVMRSNSYDDSYDEMVDRMPVYMGTGPKRKRKRRVTKEASAPAFVDQKAWDSAPASSGTSLFGGNVYAPWWALPLAVAAAGGGFFGGKYLADKVGYGLRGRRVKKRVAESEEAFDEAVDDVLKKRSSMPKLSKHITAKYAAYKEAGYPSVGGVVMGAGTALALAAALSAYNRYSGDSTSDVYRKRVLQYVPQARQPLVDVVDPSFEDEDAPVKKKITGVKSARIKSALLPAIGLGVAGVGAAITGVGAVANASKQWFGNDQSKLDFANKELSQAGDGRRQELTQPYQKVFNPPSQEGGEKAVSTIRGILGNTGVQKGIFEGIKDKMPWLESKQAMKLDWDAVKGMGSDVVSVLKSPITAAQGLGSFANTFTQSGRQQNIADQIEPKIISGLEDTSKSLGNMQSSMDFGKSLISGGATTALSRGANSAETKAVTQGIGEGIEQTIGSRNPATNAVLSMMKKKSEEQAQPSGPKRPDLSTPLAGPMREAGRNAGKFLAETDGGINDILTENIVPKFVDTELAPRLGSFGKYVSKAFAGNSGWGNAFGIMGDHPGNTMEELNNPQMARGYGPMTQSGS